MDISYPKTAILLTGLPRSGKTTFYHTVLEGRYVHLELTRLPGPAAAYALLRDCLRCGVTFAVDGGTLTRAERARWISSARAAGFRVVSFCLRVSSAQCMERLPENAPPADTERILRCARRLELPSAEEAIDALYNVYPGRDGSFTVVEQDSSVIHVFRAS